MTGHRLPGHRLPLEHFDRRQLVADPVERLTYESDAGIDSALPDGIFYPESVDDVCRMVLWAARHGVPLIARGAGTGLAGGAVAESGGIVVALTRMNRLLELDGAGRTAVVEAGAVNLEVEDQARRAGLYYPPDPSSGRSCLIGGNLGTNAGGPHCFKYGVTSNYVTGVEVVLADGRVARLGGRVADPPELDLCALIVGSEGTLGVITRAWLRLVRLPPGVRTLMVSFESLERAGEAVSAVIASGLVPAALEAIDQRGMKVIEAACQAGLPVDAGAVLIVEADGYPEGLEAQQSELAEILERHGGYDLRVARTEEERQRIWYGRKSAAGAMARVAPSYYLTDLTVRRSRLAAVLGKIHGICDRLRLETASFFHAGDGNLHPLIPYDPRDRDWTERAHQAIEEITHLCVAEDGSITGEHGVGIEKRQYMPLMYSGAELAAMRDVKRAFDPGDLFNPGKVLPDELPSPSLAEPALPSGNVASQARQRNVAPEARQRNTFTPASAEEAAAALRALTRIRRPVRIGGGKTPHRRGGGEIRLSTSKLRGVSTFAPEDLYLTAGAGTPVEEIAAYLQPHGLIAPPLAPFPGMTLGGLVASNLNAPLRMRYGALRDLTLCATVALADGRVLRAGRPLVKNVAGYDLPKLFVGSHGTLGLLTEVTLKLAAAPRARRTLALPLDDLTIGLDLAGRSLAQALVASAIVLVQDGGGSVAQEGRQRNVAPEGRQRNVAPEGRQRNTLLYTAEGMPEEVGVELAAIEEIWRQAGAGDVVETGQTGSEAWADFLGSAGTGSLAVRAGVPVKDLAAYLASRPARLGTRLLVDYASGLVYGVWRPDAAGEAATWLEELRQPAKNLGGYAVVLGAPPELAANLDNWGYEPEALDVMRRLKAAWDPAGILEPGTFLF